MTDWLDKLAEIGEAATPGPWRWKVTKVSTPDGEYVRAISAGSDDNVVAIMDSDFISVDADARFIALSRNVWESLIEIARNAEALMKIAYDDGPEEIALTAALAALRDHLEGDR